MSFEVIEPWRTAIYRKNIPELPMDEAVTEIFSTMTGSKNRSGVYGQDVDLYRPDLRPCLSRIHDEILVPAILEYITREYGLDLTADDISTSMWFIYGEENPGLDLHCHNGAQISTVLYLVGNPGDLVLTDPRHNASRGYPAKVTKKHFANYHVVPESGDLYIFPSYLQHYVKASPGKFRVSVACDAFFGDFKDY